MRVGGVRPCGAQVTGRRLQDVPHGGRGPTGVARGDLLGEEAVRVETGFVAGDGHLPEVPEYRREGDRAGERACA